MLNILSYIFELKKEVLIGIALVIIYITYYLLDAVKKPILICGEGKLRSLLEQEVPLLNERYWPTPWCVEARLQTVIGSLLRTSWLPPVEYRRELLKLPDGGQIGLDWSVGAGARVETARGVLLVVPGISGDGRADYCRCLAAAAARLRLRCVVVNYRGLAGVPLTSARLYCAVSHADVRAALEAVAGGGRGPAVAVGVSLGGLVLAQLLAAEPAAPLAAALAISSPLDVERGALAIEQGPVNRLLSRHMARRLVRTAGALRAAWGGAAGGGAGGGAVDWGAVSRARSVRQFDAAFTAPHFGFASADHYYRAATLCGKLSRVRVPLLCLCAADDPFQPFHVLPLQEAARGAHVALAVTARGGHIAFLEGAWPLAPPHRQYVARLAEQYFAAVLRTHPHPDPAPTPSPAPTAH